MNNRGITLVEILVAILLIGIISTVFVSTLVTDFTLLVDTRELTTDAFELQQAMEKEIESVKSDLSAGITPSGKASYTLFEGESNEVTIDGFYREVALAGKSIHTVIAESRIPDFPVPIAGSVNLVLEKNSTQLSDNYAYVSTSGLGAKATAVVDDPDGVFLVNRHEWFVSRPGFSIPYVSAAYIDEDFDLGRIYPIFPYDYIPVPIKANTDMLNQSAFNSITSEYTGRHIIYTISPYASSGKKGVTVFSDPVFLHGPTVTDGLVLHLDASIISRDPTVSQIEVLGNRVYVTQWDDLTGNGNHAYQVTQNLKPELRETQFSDELFVWGKSLFPNAAGTTMRINSFTPSSMNNYSVVVVAKSTAIQSDVPIVKGNSWSFGWNPSGNLSFNTGATPAELNGNLGLDGSWHVFTAIASDGGLSLRVDGVDEASGTSVTAANSSLTIDWQNVQISEILIYNRSLSGSDLASVEEYLLDKFDPDPGDVSATIVYLKTLPAKTLIQGETYQLPEVLDAVMSNGTTQKVPVTWNGNVDTSTTGTQLLTATALMDNTKTTTLVVSVVGIESLIPHTADRIRIEAGTPIALPSRLTAVLTNGDTREVDVTWTASAPGVSVSGNILSGMNIGIFSNALTAAASLDSSKTAAYDVEVTGVLVQGVTIEPKTLVLSIGQTGDLDAVVSPADAYDKSVQWSSDNHSVATVDMNGVVTAHATGSATITVTTVDGGFTDTAQITVVAAPVTVSSYDYDVRFYRSGWFTYNTVVENIVVYLTDGTVHYHSGSVQASRLFSYPPVTVSGTAIADSTGESVPYSFTYTP